MGPAGDATSAYTRELSVAFAAVHRASVVTKDVMRQLHGAHFEKDDETNSEVTIGDFAAQAIVTHTIHHYFPSDLIVAEESAEYLRKDSTACDRVWELVCQASILPTLELKVRPGIDTLEVPRIASKAAMLDVIDLSGASAPSDYHGRVWFLDPIDGTKAFLAGQQYAVALCFADNDEQRLGLLGLPNLPWTSVCTGSLTATDDVELLNDPQGYGCVAYATKGGGAYVAQTTQRAVRNEVRLGRRPAPPNLQEARFVDSRRSGSRDHQLHDKIYEQIPVERPHMDIWATQVKYAAMAMGVADAWFRIPRVDDDAQCLWDHAGGQLIYTEAGGSIEALQGSAFDFHGSRSFVGVWGYLVTDRSLMEPLREGVEKVIREHK